MVYAIMNELMDVSSEMIERYGLKAKEDRLLIKTETVSMELMFSQMEAVKVFKDGEVLINMDSFVVSLWHRCEKIHIFSRVMKM